ncbi:MAG: carbohydrate-binding protein [Dactylosporangium sp.]|nr:carbohydrate-binding protein [Dactylosporangium sp.]
MAAVAAAIAMTVTWSAQASVPATPAGWELRWSDDFTGAAGTQPSTADWLYDLGTSYPGGAANWGTGEIETMTDSVENVYLDGSGNLAIRPLRDAAGNWTSARIETQRTDFAAPAGGKLRVEGRLRLPDVTGDAAAGYWPAFWMLGDAARPVGATNWPSIGEWDIMENVNGMSSFFATLHCGTVSGGPCNETTGLSSGQQDCTGCQTSFHTFAVEYDRSVSPEQLRWYKDGTNFFSLNATQLDATTWNAATQHGFFVILNVAMGGGFPDAFGGGPTSATEPGHPLLVDYVAVYTSGETASSPTATASPTPTTAPPAGTRDAYATIEAESFDAQSGTTVEPTSDTGGGNDVGYIANGDWLQFTDVDFGSTAATQFSARVASGVDGGASGLVEVRLDSRDNAPIGDFAIGNTGGWQVWRTVPTNTSAITGRHTVYLTFTSGQPQEFVNINWFTFGR